LKTDKESKNKFNLDEDKDSKNRISISSIMSKNSKPKIPNNVVKPVGEKLIETMSRSFVSSIQ